jgi:hypothetical protein
MIFSLPASARSTCGGAADPSRIGSLRPDFHYNLKIHLPANGSEEVYLNIFNALRKVFQ